MNWIQWLLVLYGLLTIGMGVQGYVGSQSMASLIAGGGLGALVLAAVAITRTQPRIGYILALVLAVLLLGRFAPKFFGQGVLYPDGVMAIASIVAIAALASAHFLAQARK